MTKTRAKEKRVHVTVLGDSTIDNRIWVDGLKKSFLYTKLGIKRDAPAVRVKKSHRLIGKPALSVVENLMDMLPNHTIHDYTNDGFTTSDVLRGANRDKVFGRGTFSLFPNQFFRPLVDGAESIKKSQHIIISVGGNNFREFLQTAKGKSGKARKTYIKNNIQQVLDEIRDEYIAILAQVRKLNPDAQIILMTQYYPSASQNNYEIYPFMREVGKVLHIGGDSNDPMSVIHEIMKMTYTEALKRIPHDNIVVADITSSLNPFDTNNHVSQIEPSGQGGNKIAQMLKFMMKHVNGVSGQAYRFYPEFFNSREQRKHVGHTALNQWVPAHPYDVRDGYTPEEEKIYHALNADQLTCEQLLSSLQVTTYAGESFEAIGLKGRIINAMLRLRQEGDKLLDHGISPDEVKKFKMSLALAKNVAEMNVNNPDYQAAVALLQANANRCAIGQPHGWNKFAAAIVMLLAAAITALGLACIPLTGGLSALLTIPGGLLMAGGATLFHRSRERSLAKATSGLANEGNFIYERVMNR